MLDLLLKTGLQAARAAGDVISRDFQHLAGSDIQAKGKNDFVTRVDREAEAILKASIAKNFPGHRILGEESGYSRSSKRISLGNRSAGRHDQFYPGHPAFRSFHGLAERRQGYLSD